MRINLEYEDDGMRIRHEFRPENDDCFEAGELMEIFKGFMRAMTFDDGVIYAVIREAINDYD